MAKVVAIDRTENHLRYVLADVGPRGRVAVLATESLSVDADSASIPQQLGEQLRTSLAQHKAAKARVLFGVGRGALETVEFTVPTADDAELPDMVHNLAMRHVSSITDESVLDFLTSHPKQDGSRNVIAFSLRDEFQRELDVLAEAAGVTASRILVRPHELRAFVGSEESASDVMLLVSRSDQMADVLLLHPHGSALARSIRLPESSSAAKSAELAVNEIRRTLYSLPVDDFDATQIDQILFLSGEQELQQLATELGTALDARVQRRDPFAHEGVTSQPDVSGHSQFAPLVGMLIGEAQNRHPIDFLNPRRPPEPINRRKAILGAITAAAVVFGGGWFYVNGQFAEIDDENANLTSRLSELRDSVEKVEPKLALARRLRSWERSRISWLDELRDLTLRMPSSRELTVQRFSTSSARNGDASVTFSGISQSPAVVSRMEDSLRDGHHLPKTPGLRERPSEDKPVWTFQTSVIINARTAEEYTSHLPETKQEASVTDDETSAVSKTESSHDPP